MSDYAARSAIALERLADTLDDYMEMSLTLNELTGALRGSDPEMASLLKPLTDVIAEIKNQRDYRRYES